MGFEWIVIYFHSIHPFPLIIQVVFVDYGNSEVVQLSDLRTLEPSFLAALVFTFHCRLSIGSSSSSSSSWIESADSIAEEKTDDVDLFVSFLVEEDPEVVRGGDRIHNVQVIVEGKSLAQLLLKPEVVSATTVASSVRSTHSGDGPLDVGVSSQMKSSSSSFSKPRFQLAPIPKGKVVVTMSHADDVRDTFFHLYSDDVKLMSLAGILDQVYMGMPVWSHSLTLTYSHSGFLLLFFIVINKSIYTIVQRSFLWQFISPRLSWVFLILKLIYCKATDSLWKRYLILRASIFCIRSKTPSSGRLHKQPIFRVLPLADVTSLQSRDLQHFSLSLFRRLRREWRWASGSPVPSRRRFLRCKIPSRRSVV